MHAICLVEGEAFSPKGRKMLISWRKIPADQETFLWKQEKAGYQRN